MFLDPFPTFHIMRDASSKPDVSRASPALRHLGEPRWGAGGGKMEQPGLEMCWTMECTQIWRQGATQRHFGRNSRLTQTATPRPPPQMPTRPPVYTDGKHVSSSHHLVSFPLDSEPDHLFRQHPLVYCVRFAKAWR